MHADISPRRPLSRPHTGLCLALAGALVIGLGPSLLSGCGDDEKKPSDPLPQPPAITSIEPDSVRSGDSVTINGTRFGVSQGASEVRFGKLEAGTTSWTSTRIVATVPNGAVDDSITVVVDELTSNAVAYFILPEPAAPVIASIEPDSVHIGEDVTIEGSGFGATRGTSDVLFGAREAATTEWTDTRIVATVPAGAVDDSITVVVDELTSNAVAYFILPEPASPFIEKLVPARTIVNTIITIAGTGLHPQGQELTVTFAGPEGRLEAQVTAFNDNGIRAWVPLAAVDGPVRVDIGNSASNEVPFDVAPRSVKWSTDIEPLVTTVYGCTGCHGGPSPQNGLSLESAFDATHSRSFNFPVIIANESPRSILAQKISPTPPFGSRMPFGCSDGNCVTEEHQLLFRDWIDQGALND